MTPEQITYAIGGAFGLAFILIELIEIGLRKNTDRGEQ